MLEIVHRETEKGELLGVIVQLGGQTPLKLAAELQAAGVPILGTSPDSIDLAEDRERFAKLVDNLGLKQPANGIARSRDEAMMVADRIGYPVLLRPTLRARRARRWRWSTGPSSSTIISPPRCRCRATSRC